MGIIKELIKAPIETKLYNRYYSELEYSYFSYDDFAKTRESAITQSLSFSKEEIDEKVFVTGFDCFEQGIDFASIDAEYVIFASDVNGLSEFAAKIVLYEMEGDDNVQILYGDEDEFNSDETVRMNPWFKPDWSPDTLLDHFYFGNAFAVRINTIMRYASSAYNIYDLVLQITMNVNAKAIKHIDFVLFHSHYLKKLYGGNEYKELKQDFSKKLSVVDTDNSSVSIVIPSKDNPEILKKCITSIIHYTKGISYEVIVIDNGSLEENKTKIEDMITELKQDLVSGRIVEKTVDKVVLKYLYKPQPFNFSRMCNQGAKEAGGEFLLFLNDDIEVREGRWLNKMLEVAARKHAGAVGAKLYYPDSMLIQHAGITNLRLGPVHKLQFKDDNAHYYMDLNNGVHNCIAVTGACLLVNSNKFADAGGFCEELEVAFNDVDLCFRLYENGYHNAVCNNTHLWHHESLSRGQDSSQEKLARLNEERNLLYVRHPRLYARDPYYSDCLSTDILDTNYSFIYEYDYRDVIQDAVVLPFKGKIKDNWYNECLMVSLEYAGDFDKFENISNESNGYGLVCGYAFVAGSDNALFKRSIVLSGDNNSFIIRADNVYRPDLEMNLDPEEYALMTGFCIKINMKNLPKDTYRIGVLAESGSSRLKLYQETNKYIKVNV